MSLTTPLQAHIINNPISAQYEAVHDDEVVALLAYNRVADHLDLRHTYVRKDLRGQKLAHVLVAEALRMIRADGNIVTASCSYVTRFVEQHPEFADLLHDASSSGVRHQMADPPKPDTINVYPDGITSARTTLRPWALDDTESAFGIYGDADVTQRSRPSISPITDLDAMRRRLDDWIRQSNHLPRPQGRWAIELTGSGALVGGAHLLELREQGESRLVMSWELCRMACEQDLDVEVGHALAHSAFSMDPAVAAVYALADPADEHALGAFEVIGMRPLAGAEHRTPTELVRYAILRDELHAQHSTQRAAGQQTTACPTVRG